MFSKAFLKLYIQMCVGTIYVGGLQVKYTIIYSCTLMYMCSSVIHFAFAHVQINTEGDETRAKPNSVFCLVFFGEPFDLLSDCLQTSHPSLNGMNFFLCVSGSAHRVLVFTLVSPFGFSVSQRWFVWRR